MRENLPAILTAAVLLVGVAVILYLRTVQPDIDTDWGAEPRRSNPEDETRNTPL